MKRIIYLNETDCPASYPIYDAINKECYFCDYNHIKSGECSLDNDEEISQKEKYEIIKNGIILDYIAEDDYFTIDGTDSFIYQISSIKNELKYLEEDTKSKYSIINLKECVDILKRENGLDPDTDLIILKYENEDYDYSNGNEKSIQYEVYIPNSNKKLDLSVCSNTQIDMYIPVELNEETQKLYEELKSQGYNLFDKNDKFYTDICSPYKSKDETDVLLSDRYNDFFLPNQLNCQANCEYSDYDPIKQYLKCRCNVVNNEKMEVKEPKKVTAKSIVKSFYDILKYSNYKVLKCYKLVFRGVTFSENAGSILTYLYFIGFIITFIIFIYRKYTYLNEEIKKLYENFENEENKDIIKDNPIIFKGNKEDNKQNIIEDIKEEKIDVQRLDKKRNTAVKYRNKIKNSESINDSCSVKSQNKILDNKSNNNMLNKKLPILADPISVEPINTNVEENVENENKENNADKLENENLSDFELNKLEYAIAFETDKRNFLKLYWYFLKREQLILFTFFNLKDFNLFTIKLSRFFLAICTDMAFNVFFFADESMHDIYTSGGKHDFISQLGQMIYSTIIGQLLQILINYLTMTDIQYYKIKALAREKNLNQNQNVKVMKYINYKIIIFYSLSFLLFLFFWYLISAFCAVYENTQRIFIVDSITSFFIELLYPFVLYLIPAGLRLLSLRKKNLRFIYSLSNQIPIF